MRFLVDECTGPGVARWLKKQGYEVFSVFEQARGMSDEDVIEKAFTENWILITNDKQSLPGQTDTPRGHFFTTKR